MLIINNVSKSSDGKTKALNDVSLEVDSGDIYAFIGHNGAGKTTLIKSIVGIQSFDSGEILVDNLNVKDYANEVKKIISYIPDEPEAFDSLTGLEFLNFIADAYDVSIEDRKREIEKYAKEFEMEEHLKSTIGSYSHGMKQKIVIISALIHKTKLIVMDEPFVGLDPKASFTFKNIMREYVSNGGSIFFSTHVLDVAEKLCNKIAVIKNGEIIKSGRMDEVASDESLEQVFMELLEEKNNA